jgi:hypothetical protein
LVVVVMVVVMVVERKAIWREAVLGDVKLLEGLQSDR